jgi:hypothetical protein
MAYDRADWHYGGDFPDDVPDENGATHIGMFLAWAINNNLEGDLHREDSIEALTSVRERQMTGRYFLINECDEKFWEEDLNDLGNAFAGEYYGLNEVGLYFADYADVLCEGNNKRFYYVEDTWENYNKLAPIVSRRFEEWKAKNA